MALRWLRGVLPTHDPSTTTNNYVDAQKEHNVIVHYFLHRVLGWSLADEVIAGSGSFQNNHSLTGTDGVLSNSTLTFTSATGGFAASDVGKYLCIVDASSDKNCGIYPISGYTDTNNVTINFLTSAGNYPDTATDITFYLLDPTNCPTLQDSYYVLDTGHATVPSTLKCQQKGYSQVGNPASANLGTFIHLAGQPATEAWDATGHDWKAAAKYNDSIMVKISSGAYNDTAKARIYGVGDTDGSFFVFWCRFNNETEESQVTFFSVLDMFETGRIAAEKVCLHGPWYDTSYGHNSTLNTNGGDHGTGVCYSEKGQKGSLLTYLGGYMYNGTNAYFRTDVGGPNARTGKRDALPIWVFMDPANSSDVWAPLGSLNENILRAQVIDIGSWNTFDTAQYYHLLEGLVVPWPGVPLP